MNKLKNIMNSSELIDNLIDDTHYLIKEVEQKILPLSKEALTFKSGDKVLSILECIEHVNKGAVANT